MYVSPEWLGAIATVLLAAAAAATILRDEIRYWFRHPDFEIRFKPSQPDCHKVRLDWRNGEQSGSAQTHYVRCRVRNKGKSAARDVEISVLKIRKKNAAGKYEDHPIGTPWQLVWAHRNDPRLLPHVLDQLPVETERHIALGHVVDPKKRRDVPGEDDPSKSLAAGETLFCLEFFVKSNTAEYLLDAGQYEITFQVSAGNAKSRNFVFRLNHTGRWFDDEQRMYSDGLGLEIAGASSEEPAA